MEEINIPRNELIENGIQILVDMGFPREKAEIAFLNTGSESVELAAAYLLNADTVEEVATFSDDEDEWEDVDQSHFKMVFVVNVELKMSIGKTAAQVAHGCLGLYREIEHGTRQEKKLDLKNWIDEGQKKIVLSGTNTEALQELCSKATSQGVPCHLVRDAGHTEVTPGSVTVLVLFGLEEDVNKITGSLRLLK